MSDFDSGECVLLTGAGFTANFGAPLAQGMWTEIFNHPGLQAEGSLRLALLGDFDFEAVYFDVMTCTRFDAHARSVLTEAILAAYHGMDETLRSYCKDGKNCHPVCIAKLSALLRGLAQGGKKGFFFTLNQDLFVERYLQSKLGLVVPGVPGGENGFHIYPNRPLGDQDTRQVPTEDDLAARKDADLEHGSLLYAKLHGSLNWRTSDGSHQLVIGRGKEHQIDREPLLRWYLDLFRNALCRPSRRLLVIGYSFCDQHINRVIAEAIEQHGLRLYMINLESPKEFMDRLDQRRSETSDDIVRSAQVGLAGYYPFPLSRLCPTDGPATREFRSLHERFLGIEHSPFLGR